MPHRRQISSPDVTTWHDHFESDYAHHSARLSVPSLLSDSFYVLLKGKLYPGFLLTAKAVANKGEAYRSALDDTPEAVQAFVGLHGFRLQQHMGPRQVLGRARN